MGKINTAWELFRKNRGEFWTNLLIPVSFLFSDKFYLEILFRLKMGYPLDLDNPTTFNEKLQWLKLYNRRPEYSIMVDKLKVKEYVAGIIGPQYVLPTLGVWSNTDDINWADLPNRFVLKTTHGGGGVGVLICKDKTKLDIRNTCHMLNRSIKQSIYIYYREWPYKNVRRNIIAEPFLINNDNPDGDLRDYKLFCFNGVVKFLKIDFDRFVDHHANYYLRDGELLKFGEVNCPPDYSKHMEMPKYLNTMVSLAEKISKDHPFMRVDFYECNDSVYFGEITFFPAGGFGRFTDDAWDIRIGQMLKLK